MNKEFEKKPQEQVNVRREAKYIYSEQIEEISLRAAQMHEFQDAVKQAQGKFKALTVVRELLPKHFPEIKDIPPPRIESQGLTHPVPNEFRIAKHIVELLELEIKKR